MSREQTCANCGHDRIDHSVLSENEDCMVHDCPCAMFAVGPYKIDCPCGCGKNSMARKNGHVRSCPCPKCRGGRNRRKGLNKQRVARKRLGVPDAKVGSILSNEEGWGGYFRDEVKEGKQVGPAATAFLKAEKQLEQNRPVGDIRPGRVTLMPEGWGNEGLVVVRLSVWETHVQPAVDEFNGVPDHVHGSGA